MRTPMPRSIRRSPTPTAGALNKFKAHYGKQFPGAGRSPANTRSGAGAPPGPRPSPWSSQKDAIFAYCYAVLHDPVYREKYALNLKREFPRIPFYDDFALWAGWGQQLLDLHIGYEQAKPSEVQRVDNPSPAGRGRSRAAAEGEGDGASPSDLPHPTLSGRERAFDPKPKLKSDPERGLIVIDEDTQLSGIPREAWDYRLGNRSAIDWVLDQHKEKTPRDPTVREKFNTYRFADYKESMIDLLARVITVSLATVSITEAMRALDREKP